MGNNHFGQLGDGSQYNTENTFQPVVGGKGYAEAFTYAGYTCGLKLDGTLNCWGSNPPGDKFGNCTSGTSLTPVAAAVVNGPPEFPS